MIFWDVDTQIDFMEPAGKLYVPGAEEIRSNLAYLTNMGSGVRLSGSVDAHVPDDRARAMFSIPVPPKLRTTE